MNTIYLDNGATTKTDPKVVEAMLPYFTEKYGNASSIHHKGEEARKALDSARETIANAINAEPGEIIFTSGGTESDNIAILGAVYANKKKGDHIITSKIEHPAVLNTCKALEKEGFKVTYIDVDSEGRIDLDQLKKSITKKTILVTIIHANNEIGAIQPIDEIGKICKKSNIIFHSDAVQSFTKVPFDVKEINIDMLSFSGHKIHGPKGIGALYVRKGTSLKSITHGGSHELKMRPGTENMPGIVGFAEAVEIADPKYNEAMKKLRNKFIDEILNKIPYARLNGSRENRLCNNINISFEYVEGESILLHLDNKGICVSTGSACSSHSLQPSYVLTAIGLSPEIAHGSIRFTLSKYTTEQEIDYTIKNLIEIINDLRKISSLT